MLVRETTPNVLEIVLGNDDVRVLTEERSIKAAVGGTKSHLTVHRRYCIDKPRPVIETSGNITVDIPLDYLTPEEMRKSQGNMYPLLTASRAATPQQITFSYSETPSPVPA